MEKCIFDVTYYIISIISSTPLSSAGPGGASEAGAEGGGPCSEGGSQEDLRHPEAAVRPGAADTALRTGGRGESKAG